MNALETFMSLANDETEVVRVRVSDTKELIVRRLLLCDLPAIEAAMNDKTDTREKMVGLLKLALCDENGDRLIQTEEQEALLNKMPLGVMRVVFNRAAKINGLVEDDEGN